ncbi:Glu-tRNA(Gln) amidotransferase GatDE subunit E [Candidatus Woesearchaeota archaeon CG10_big_fil_rev_8_21_14_0_10_45_16]|nr:MAG: Glu-tRNA(Gln) amidotransferase GatDE subunit E [Candidatus Woesearchaeota archaeon CG10_big_fil_rev_8_21_14_0_10_45_16]
MSIKDLGLKCGIEIHQQLDGKKLFCDCPTVIRDDQPHFTVQRKLRASAGESGEMDVAALQEQLRDRTFIYEGYKDTTCLVETDSEPPHELNQAALYTALQFCKTIKADISPIVQVMRKTVVDGSNTSGFQRTALVARNGLVETSEGKVSIANVSLEEDSCKIISDKAEEKVYRLDRLGVPLIEIGTNPDIKSPEQCQETARKIGMLLRSLPGVKRGLGTIRQDVNVSIKGGTRIEIKGAQDLRQLPLLVELEAKRQFELLRLKKELKWKLEKLNIIDISSVFERSDSKIIKNTFEKNGKILALKLKSFAGLLGRELQPGYRLGTEFSGRAKIKAGVGGIFHSDELPKYGITEEDVTAIRRVLKCSGDDGFVLVADEEKKARLALEAVHERAGELFMGVPPEVRKANADGTTSYLRPMPGAARMYPETDVPLIVPEKDVKIPELLEEKISRYQQKLGLSSDLATFIAKSDQVMLFEELVKRYPKQKAAFIAETLTSTPLEIKRKYGLDSDTLTEENFKDLFKYLEDGKIHKDIVLDVLIDMVKGTFDLKRYDQLGTEDIHAVIKKIIEQNPGAPFGALMGKCMKELAGKASGEFISAELKKLL